MQILQVPPHWPDLPLTEIVVVGEETADRALVQPLLSFLADGLRAPLEA
jgi:hypothetical protein